MAESKSTAATTNHVKGKDINGQMVTLERTQPRQLSLFQTFLPDEERYSNTIDLYDALPKYFSNHTIMRSLRKSGQYLPVLKREFEHKGASSLPPGTTPYNGKLICRQLYAPSSTGCRRVLNVR